jgi:formate dehydrogenase iron-sulfur subunit
MSHAVLVDLVRCIGCRSCQVACKAWNDNRAEVTLCLGCYDNPPNFSSDTWSLIRFAEVEQGDGLHWVFTKLQCMHCEHPGCVSVCTVGALEKTASGPVIYHDNKCIGCRYCQYGCPFGVPKYEWEKQLGLIRKCTFCADRLADGLEPACVKACPTDALMLGDREQLLTEARRRITARPGKYVNHVYGEKEAGGTSWLYISPVPFTELGFPELGEEHVTLASEAILNSTPVTIIAAVAGLSGLYWLTKRRDEMKAKEGQR